MSFEWIRWRLSTGPDNEIETQLWKYSVYLFFLTRNGTWFTAEMSLPWRYIHFTVLCCSETRIGFVLCSTTTLTTSKSVCTFCVCLHPIQPSSKCGMQNNHTKKCKQSNFFLFFFKQKQLRTIENEIKIRKKTLCVCVRANISLWIPKKKPPIQNQTRLVWILLFFFSLSRSG